MDCPARATVYGRVDQHLLELVADRSVSRLAENDRGKERRRRVLMYISDHSEELRPVSRALALKEASRELDGYSFHPIGSAIARAREPLRPDSTRDAAASGARRHRSALHCRGRAWPVPARWTPPALW